MNIGYSGKELNAGRGSEKYLQLCISLKQGISFSKHGIELKAFACLNLLFAPGKQSQKLKFMLRMLVFFDADHYSRSTAALSDKDRLTTGADAFYERCGTLAQICNRDYAGNFGHLYYLQS